MNPNPILRQLGLADNDRVVLVHADDVGMCQASVAAFADLMANGLVSCGATMAPCSWFPAAAGLCRRTPGVDMGVHTDLTAEWDSYRWAPISTCDPATGLIDDEGYFYRTSADVQAHARPEAVAAELEAQIKRALAAGIDVTHIDTHMGAVAHVRFMSAYVQLALKYRVPAMIPRLDRTGWQARGMDAESAALAEQTVLGLAERGLPLVDNIAGLPLEQPVDRIGRAKAAFAALPPGLTHFIIHPAVDTPELRAIAPDWRGRVADYEAFMSDELRAYVRGAGLHIIGYRALRDLLRKGE